MPITPSTKFKRLNKITPPPVSATSTPSPGSNTGEEKLSRKGDAGHNRNSAALAQKGEQKRTTSKPLSPQRPRQKAKNVSRDKLGKKSSGVTNPEHVVQSYNTKRMEDFFQVLNRALEKDWTLNTRRWELNQPTLIPPFTSGSLISARATDSQKSNQSETTETQVQQQTRAQLANSCLYFSQAVVSRANDLDKSHRSLPRKRSEIGSDDDDVVKQRILKTASMRLKQLEQRHKQYGSRLKARKSMFENSIHSFTEHVDASFGSVKTKDCLYRRKLRVQSDIANRRLQELLFECLGEISKACRRASILGRKLCENVDAEKAHSTLSTQWREFAMRLNEESDGSCKFVPVEQFRFPKEFKAWENECLDVLASSKLISPTKQKQVKLRRILHLCGRKKKASKDNRRRVTKLYQSRGGVRGLIAQIMSEYNVKHSRLVDGLKTGDSSMEGNNTSGKAFMPLYPAPMPITSKALQWVLPSANSYPDARIYYCIEERLLHRYQMFTKDPTMQSAYLAEQAKKATRPSSGGGAGNSNVSPDVLSRVADALSRFLASSYVPGCREDPELSQEERSSGFHSGWKPPEWLIKVIKRLDRQANNGFKQGDRKKRRRTDLVCHVDSVEQSHRKQSHLSALDSVPSSTTMGASLQSGSESYEEAILTQQFMNALPDILRVKFTDVDVSALNESSELKENDSGEEDLDDETFHRQTKFQAKRKAKINHYLHFAPASVIHVIETKAFAEVLRLLSPSDRSKIESNYPNRTVIRSALSSLYVLVDKRESRHMEVIPQEEGLG